MYKCFVCFSDEIKAACEKVRNHFDSVGKTDLSLEELGPVALCCGLTSYWKAALFKASVRNKCSRVSCEDVTTTWTNIASRNHDLPSKFVHLLSKRGRSYLDFEDFVVLLKVSINLSSVISSCEMLEVPSRSLFLISYNVTYKAIVISDLDAINAFTYALHLLQPSIKGQLLAV